MVLESFNTVSLPKDFAELKRLKPNGTIGTSTLKNTPVESILGFANNGEGIYFCGTFGRDVTAIIRNCRREDISKKVNKMVSLIHKNYNYEDLDQKNYPEKGTWEELKEAFEEAQEGNSTYYYNSTIVEEIVSEVYRKYAFILATTQDLPEGEQPVDLNNFSPPIQGVKSSYISFEKASLVLKENLNFLESNEGDFFVELNIGEIIKIDMREKKLFQLKEEMKSLDNSLKEEHRKDFSRLKEEIKSLNDSLKEARKSKDNWMNHYSRILNSIGEASEIFEEEWDKNFYEGFLRLPEMSFDQRKEFGNRIRSLIRRRIFYSIG